MNTARNERSNATHLSAPGKCQRWGSLLFRVHSFGIIGFRTRSIQWCLGKFGKVWASSLSSSSHDERTETARRREAGTPTFDEYTRTRHKHNLADSTSLNHTTYTPLTIANKCIARTCFLYGSAQHQSGCAHSASGNKHASKHKADRPASAPRADKHPGRTCCHHLRTDASARQSHIGMGHMCRLRSIGDIAAHTPSSYTLPNIPVATNQKKHTEPHEACACILRTT